MRSESTIVIHPMIHLFQTSPRILAMTMLSRTLFKMTVYVFTGQWQCMKKVKNKSRIVTLREFPFLTRFQVLQHLSPNYTLA